jgi:hypothetical protein
MWLFGTTEVVPFPKSSSSGLAFKISAASTVVGTPVGGGGALGWHGVLRRAKGALLRMTGGCCDRAVGLRSELVLSLRDLVLFLISRTPDLRPGLSYAAPSGRGLAARTGSFSICVTSKSPLWSQRARLEWGALGGVKQQVPRLRMMFASRKSCCARNDKLGESIS